MMLDGFERKRNWLHVPALILGNDWHVVLADMGEVQNGTLLAENEKPGRAGAKIRETW